MPAAAASPSGSPSQLHQLLDPSGVLAGILAAERLRRSAQAGRLAAGDVARLTHAARQGEDHLVRAGALRVLSAVPGATASRVLVDALCGDPASAEHAAWALGGRDVQPDAVGPLLALIAEGGFRGTVALATLQSWAEGDRTGLGALTTGALRGLRQARGPARTALVEVLGLTGGSVAGNVLRALAADEDEESATRAAATAALARHPRPGRASLLSRLAADPDAAVRGAALRTRLALLPAPPAAAPRSGLRVAQVMLQGRLDADLSAAGTGDGGGLVTLLVNLARELAAQPGVDEVVTLARDPSGQEADPRPAEPLGRGAAIEWLQAGPAGPASAGELWGFRLDVEAELARLLRRPAAVDVVHLRATDAGSWAAMRVCRTLGLPYVVTVAPDPANVIQAAEGAGTLTRDAFAAADAAEHWWFRIGLLGDLVESAAGLVAFPRAGGPAALASLTGLDLPEGAVTVVPEGASLRATARAFAAVRVARRGGPRPPVLDDLAGRIGALPLQRRGLPLLVSAGRLHPIKGMARLVEAWAATPRLLEAFNLVILGGDLAQPSGVERGVVDAISGVLDRHPGADAGLVLLGARPHADVALVLAAARAGLQPAVGPDGVYACASVKEEFGLSLVEALAAGLVVVAPDDGGPPTYVEDGVTGVLVDTSSTAAVAHGIARAATLRRDPHRAERARAHVAEQVNLSRMAAALVGVYRRAGGRVSARRTGDGVAQG